MASSSGMYGMVGIGIAAAVGFVFALSLLSNSGIVGDGGQTPEEFQQRESSTTSGEDATTMMEFNDEGQANMKTTGNDSSSGGMLTMEAPSGDLNPALASLAVLNSKREVIGEVGEGREFKVGEAVFIEGILHNPHDTELLPQGISLAVVNSANEMEPEGIAVFNGIVPAGGNLALDLYWKPGAAGNYRIVLSSDNVAEPIASVQVRAVD